MKYLVLLLVMMIFITCDNNANESKNDDSNQVFDCRRGSPCNDGFSCRLNSINKYECLPNNTEANNGSKTTAGSTSNTDIEEDFLGDMNTEEDVIAGTANAGEDAIAGTSNAGESIIAGTSNAGEDAIAGTSNAGENIIAGTSNAGESIIAGTSNAGEDTIAGTSAGTTAGTAAMGNCDVSCSSFAQCAVDECTGYNETGFNALKDYCLGVCTPVTAAVIDNKTTCQDKFDFFSNGGFRSFYFFCDSITNGFCERYNIFCGDWEDEMICEEWYRNSPEGVFGDMNGATQACYNYHIAEAESDAETHCQHARGETVCVDDVVGGNEGD